MIGTLARLRVVGGLATSVAGAIHVEQYGDDFPGNGAISVVAELIAQLAIQHSRAPRGTRSAQSRMPSPMPRTDQVSQTRQIASRGNPAPQVCSQTVEYA